MMQKPAMVRTGLLPGTLLLAVTAIAADMDCMNCHQMHGAAGGTLNIADEFNLICDTCHGPAGTAVYADRHVDPNASFQNDPTGTVTPAWEWTCITCHRPHPRDTVNHLYNDGTPHAHTLGGDTGNLVEGRNIKLFGRDEDGTGVSKIAIPLRILALEADSPLCLNSNTDLRVAFPTFAEGDGPLHSVMIGDRITILNTDSAYAGTWRVKEAAWSLFQGTDGEGMVCFDGPAATGPAPFIVIAASYDAQRNEVTLTLDRSHPFGRDDVVTVSGIVSSGPGSYNGTFTLNRAPSATQIGYDLETNPGTWISGGSIPDPGGGSPLATAWLRSTGWHDRPRLSDAGWLSGTATLTLRGRFSMRVGDTFNLGGATSAGPGSFDGVHTVAAVTSSRVTNAAWSAGTATLTLDQAHLYEVGEAIEVTDVRSNGAGTFDGDHTISAVSGLDISYALASDPGAYVASNGSVDLRGGFSRIAYALGTDPGATTDVTAARIEYAASVKSVQSMSITGSTTMDITLAGSNPAIHHFQAATPGVRDGDIINVFGVEPDGYNGRWEVAAVALPVISVRCPPFTRTGLSVPACSLAGAGTYVSGGDIQSTGSMRPVVFESRGPDNNVAGYLSDYTHAFSNTDEDEDGYMDGPCETCHTQAGKHLNDDFGDTHNNDRTCTDGCHSHSVGFDKDNDFCPAGRICPPTN